MENTVSSAQMAKVLSPDRVEFLNRAVSLQGGPVHETTGDMTFYVRTDGDDAHDGLSESSALATVEAALAKIPKVLKHAVIVSVGPGEFAGFGLAGFQALHPNGCLLIQGSWAAATPTTGTASGTSTSGDALSLTDSGQSWTTDDLKGKVLQVGSEYRYIRSNDATQVQVVGAFSASTSGKAYAVVEHGTILNSARSSVVYAMIEAIGNLAAGNTLTSPYQVSCFRVEGGGYYDAIWQWDTHGVSLSHIQGTGNYWGGGGELVRGRFYVNDVWMESAGVASGGLLYWNYVDSLRINRIYAYDSGGSGLRIAVAQHVEGEYFYLVDNAEHGVDLTVCQFVGLSNVVATGNGESGIYSLYSSVVSFINPVLTGNAVGATSYGTDHFDFDGSSLDISANTSHGIFAGQATRFVDIDGGSISNNGGFGVVLDENALGNRGGGSFLNAAGTITITGNALGGIIGKCDSGMALTDVSGSNTGGYGVELQVGSYAIVTGDTDLTGGSGDATIDGGSTALVWATDFAANGAAEANTSNFCRIERRDS